MAMHSWTAPAEITESELREWCALNCHNGWRIEPSDTYPVQVFHFEAVKPGWKPHGPTLFVNDEHELVHAKLRFS